jgi:hypothetical protein
MSQPILSILIPTVVGREDVLNNGFFKTSKEKIFHSYTDGYLNISCKDFEIILSKDNKEMSIGEKRELLYKRANGIYSLQVDDDDELATNAIELILQAIKENPDVDCITFRERCMMNGVYKSSNHSLKYEKWQDNFDGFDYVRCPFYKDVIRTDIAKSVPFPHIRYNEDEQWSMALRPHLKTEYHIDKELYYYIYEPKESHEERYGLNRD